MMKNCDLTVLFENPSIFYAMRNSMMLSNGTEDIDINYNKKFTEISDKLMPHLGKTIHVGTRNQNSFFIRPEQDEHGLKFNATIVRKFT